MRQKSLIPGVLGDEVQGTRAQNLFISKSGSGGGAPSIPIRGLQCRVPTGTGKPGKMTQLFPVREKSGNFCSIKTNDFGSNLTGGNFIWFQNTEDKSMESCFNSRPCKSYNITAFKWLPWERLLMETTSCQLL